MCWQRFSEFEEKARCEMAKWLVKKVVVGKVNQILDVNQENIVTVKNTLDTWIGRLDRILSCLKAILSKLDDNKLDSAEIDESVAEIKKVVKAW